MAELFAVVAEMVMSFFFGATQARQPTVRRRAADAVDRPPGPTLDRPLYGESDRADGEGGPAGDPEHRENSCT